MRRNFENNNDFPGYLRNHRMISRPCGRVGWKQKDAVSRGLIEQIKVQDAQLNSNFKETTHYLLV